MQINTKVVFLESNGPIRDLDGRIIAPAQRWPIELPDNHPFTEDLNEATPTLRDRRAPDTRLER